MGKRGTSLPEDPSRDHIILRTCTFRITGRRKGKGEGNIKKITHMDKIVKIGMQLCSHRIHILQFFRIHSIAQGRASKKSDELDF